MIRDEGRLYWKKQWTKTIQDNSAMLFWTKLPSSLIDSVGVGLYSLRGRIYGAKGLGDRNVVTSRLYIYEALD